MISSTNNIPKLGSGAHTSLVNKVHPQWCSGSGDYLNMSASRSYVPPASTSGAIHRLVPTFMVIVPGVAERTEARGLLGSASRAKPKSHLLCRTGAQGGALVTSNPWFNR